MIKKGPSVIVEQAEVALKQSINSYLLFDFNFPGEAIIAITQLAKAIEALLSEAIERDEGSKPENMHISIERYWKNDYAKKSSAHWLRKKRNNVVHPNEVIWEEKIIVGEHLRDSYKLAGELYIDLGYEFEDTFSTSETRVLSGSVPDWQDLAKVWAKEALQYFDSDTETAIQIANEAFDLALRGFLKSWRIENVDQMNQVQLRKAIQDYDDYWYDSPYYGQEIAIDTASPFYVVHLENGDEYRNPWEGWFCPPMQIHDLMESRIASHGSKTAVLIYLEEVQKAVSSYVARHPDLDFYECLLDSWDKIMDEMKLRYREIKLPTINENLGIDPWWDDPKAIVIYINENLVDLGWNEEYILSLREIMMDKCGEIPDNLPIRFSWTRGWWTIYPNIDLKTSDI